MTRWNHGSIIDAIRKKKEKIHLIPASGSTQIPLFRKMDFVGGRRSGDHDDDGDPFEYMTGKESSNFFFGNIQPAINH